MEKKVSQEVKVVVDVDGGDFAPESILEGILKFLDSSSSNVKLVLAGTSESLSHPLWQKLSFYSSLIEKLEVTQVIEMAESPSEAYRLKLDSSIGRGLQLLKEKKAQAFVSAGNSGAVVAFALLILGRIHRLSRPAILVTLPGLNGPVVFLDAGANVDCREKHLLHFAKMGEVYARQVLNISEPKVALLNIGEEEGKGSELVKAAYKLLKSEIPSFIGNIEGKDIFVNHADVVVTDGFTGNVALKLMEGEAAAIFRQLEMAVKRSILTRLAGWVLKKPFKKVAEKLSYENYGGAQLVGVNGVVTIAHGRSNARAISNAIKFSVKTYRQQVVEKIKEELAKK